MELTFDPKAPINQGVTQQGPLAKAYKPQGETTWNWAVIDPSTLDDPQAIPATITLVNSLKAITPADVLEFVKVTTNGNYLVTIKRQTIPQAAKDARKLADTQAKANYQATKGQAKAPRATIVPTIVGQAPATVETLAATPIPAMVAKGSGSTLTKAEVASFLAMGYTLAEVADMLKAESAPTLPLVTESAPEAPKVPQVNSKATIPSVATGKGGSLAPKVTGK